MAQSPWERGPLSPVTIAAETPQTRWRCPEALTSARGSRWSFSGSLFLESSTSGKATPGPGPSPAAAQRLPSLGGGGSCVPTHHLRILEHQGRGGLAGYHLRIPTLSKTRYHPRFLEPPSPRSNELGSAPPPAPASPFLPWWGPRL